MAPAGEAGEAGGEAAMAGLATGVEVPVSAI